MASCRSREADTCMLQLQRVCRPLLARPCAATCTWQVACICPSMMRGMHRSHRSGTSKLSRPSVRDPASVWPPDCTQTLRCRCGSWWPRCRSAGTRPSLSLPRSRLPTSQVAPPAAHLTGTTSVGCVVCLDVVTSLRPCMQWLACASGRALSLEHAEVASMWGKTGRRPLLLQMLPSLCTGSSGGRSCCACSSSASACMRWTPMPLCRHRSPRSQSPR